MLVMSDVCQLWHKMLLTALLQILCSVLLTSLSAEPSSRGSVVQLLLPLSGSWKRRT